MKKNNFKLSITNNGNVVVYRGKGPLREAYVYKADGTIVHNNKARHWKYTKINDRYVFSKAESYYTDWTEKPTMKEVWKKIAELHEEKK